MTKVFLTGVTGYIGGDVFYALNEAYPEFEWTLLVRSEEKGKKVLAKYPKVRIVYGDNNSADVLEREAAAADIVIHTAESADDVPSAKAIAAGIAKGHTADHPGFWLHVSGTGILTWYDYAHKRWGQPPLPEERYNDVDDIARVTSLPDEALHRVVDKIVLANTSADGPVRTAIIAPPTIYGLGRGPVNTRSIQLYELAKYTLTTARAEGADGIGLYPVVETGKNEWDYVHIADLSRLFVVLVAAVLDPARNSDPEIFGPKGYFFAEAGSYVWGEAARTVAEEAQRQGWVRGIKERKISSKEIDEGSQDKLAAHNSKSVAARARSILGWMPVERTYYDEIPFAVAQEAEQLGLEKLVPGETDELP